MPGETGALEQAQVSLTRTGEFHAAPPTFLERWGVVLLACFGGWVLLFSMILLGFYLQHLPPLPAETGRSADEVKILLDQHRSLLEQYRDSVSFIFDLMVTRTVLPLITLLLGYLFGRAKIA